MNDTPPKSNLAPGSSSDLAHALSQATLRRWRVFDYRPTPKYSASAIDLPLGISADFPRLPPFTFQTEADDPQYAA